MNSLLFTGSFQINGVNFSVSDTEDDLYAIHDTYTQRFGANALQPVGLKWDEFDYGLINYSEATRKKFTNALQRSDKLVHILIGKNDSDPGLLKQLSTSIESFVIQQTRASGCGNLVDLYA